MNSSRALALLALVVATGCSGVRVKDVSSEPPAAPIASFTTLRCRAVIDSRVEEHVLPDEDSPRRVERSQLAGVLAARELGGRLVAAGVFTDATPRETADAPRPDDVPLLLVEEILEAPRYELGPRRLLTGIPAFWPFLPIMLPIDALYVEHGPPLEVRYILEGRGLRFETTARVTIEEQVLGCNEDRDSVRNWIPHASALRLARERSLAVLVARLAEKLSR
jgi:hypothetical protein